MTERHGVSSSLGSTIENGDESPGGAVAHQTAADKSPSENPARCDNLRWRRIARPRHETTAQPSDWLNSDHPFTLDHVPSHAAGYRGSSGLRVGLACVQCRPRRCRRRETWGGKCGCGRENRVLASWRDSAKPVPSALVAKDWVRTTVRSPDDVCSSFVFRHSVRTCNGAVQMQAVRLLALKRGHRELLRLRTARFSAPSNSAALVGSVGCRNPCNGENSSSFVHRHPSWQWLQ
jgi:hypothetical protein